MKKLIKIIFIVIGVIIGIIVLDSLQALIFNNNPFIGVETRCMRKEGVLVDTYHCGNGKNITKIKLFNSSCDSENVCGKNFNSTANFTIIDKSKEIEDFSCDAALEKFYEDKNYTYSYGCIKSDYVIVRYNDETFETVKEALSNGRITINDLDEFEIKYIKQEK